MGCKRVGRQCTRCPAARPGAHGVDTVDTRRARSQDGVRTSRQSITTHAVRQACLSNRQVLSRTNHGVVFMGADSLVTVSTVIQQSITGVAHVRLAVRGPRTGPVLPAARAVEECSKVLVRRASAWRWNCRTRARRAQSYGVAPRSSSTRRYRTASRFVIGLSIHDFGARVRLAARSCRPPHVWRVACLRQAEQRASAVCFSRMSPDLSVSYAVEGASHLPVHMALSDARVDPSGCSGAGDSPTRWRCSLVSVARRVQACSVPEQQCSQAMSQLLVAGSAPWSGSESPSIQH